MAGLSADQGASSQLIQQKLTQFLEILRQDPAARPPVALPAATLLQS
jgi:hypothetical protein